MGRWLTFLFFTLVVSFFGCTGGSNPSGDPNQQSGINASIGTKTYGRPGDATEEVPGFAISFKGKPARPVCQTKSVAGAKKLACATGIFTENGLKKADGIEAGTRVEWQTPTASTPGQPGFNNCAPVNDGLDFNCNMTNASTAGIYSVSVDTVEIASGERIRHRSSASTVEVEEGPAGVASLLNPTRPVCALTTDTEIRCIAHVFANGFLVPATGIGSGLKMTWQDPPTLVEGWAILETCSDPEQLVWSCALTSPSNPLAYEVVLQLKDVNPTENIIEHSTIATY